ncbi:DinB family protein [Streptomyces sp. TRM68367]|uniref:DinB family protein n=1 Tax=Streptomyces sp. TRM68367 TaxID=2758415 RepID=UPI00165CDC54|nr:DinB family protein [Streptomyces sp. TRM68367]MBC9727861.1 DinB family protein [Streptomyces sp. TRM68367]
MTTAMQNQNPAPSLPDECDELLHALAEQRELLLITVRGLTDAQAARRTTVSELTLGGIVKHLAQGEEVWTQIMVKGDGELPDSMLDMGQYRMAETDTLTGLLERYAAASRATDRAVAALPDPGRRVPLPVTPWSPPEREYWSARRILLHLIRETAQHAGHADIIREALDGANTTAQR